MQCPSEHLAVQAALNAAAVDADLEARGGHVALIVGGILLTRLDGAVAAADGELAAAEVRRRLRQLYRVCLPEGLKRLELMAALVRVLLTADDADGNAPLCEDSRIGIGEFLFEVAAQLTEVRLGALRCGLEALELLLAAADADGGAGLMQDGAVALMDPCAHPSVDGGIGRGYTAVPVRRRILFGAALKEPQLGLLAEVGEGVLQPAAVLIERRLRPAAAGDGQSRAEVRDAGAAVVDGDVDIVAAIRETEDDLAAAAVRLDGGDGVVHQLLDGLGGRGVVASNGLEQGEAAGGVVEQRVADADAGGLIAVLGGYGVCAVEEALDVVSRIHGSYLL